MKPFIYSCYAISILSNTFPILAADNNLLRTSDITSKCLNTISKNRSDDFPHTYVLSLVTRRKLTNAWLVNTFTALWIYHCCVYTIPLLNPVPRNMNPLHSHLQHFFNDHLCINILLCLIFANVTLHSVLFVCLSHSC
jgi:ABC-type uncharacterized transport system permease subunit